MWEGGLFWGAMAMVAYGAANALAHILMLIRSLRPRPPLVAYLVVVRDRADRVEGVVRALARTDNSDLLLIDLASGDESLAILERLALDYEHARLFPFGRDQRAEAIAAALGATRSPFVVLVDLDSEMEKEGNSRSGGEPLE